MRSYFLSFFLIFSIIVSQGVIAIPDRGRDAGLRLLLHSAQIVVLCY